jgi:hypothetical protein
MARCTKDLNNVAAASRWLPKSTGKLHAAQEGLNGDRRRGIKIVPALGEWMSLSLAGMI